jgi:ABC-2 type transport system permease protein
VNWRLVGEIVKLRLRRTAADKSNLVWLFLMPLVFAFFMGFLMGDWSDAPKTRPAFLVSDADRSDVSANLLVSLKDNPDFLLVQADTVISAAQARAFVETKANPAVLLISPGFGDSLAAGQAPHPRLFHDSDRDSAQKVRQALAGAVAAAAARAAARSLLLPDPDRSAAATPASFDENRYAALLANPRVRLVATKLGRARGEDLALTDARQHLGPSYALMFTLMFLLMSAKDLVEERRLRTLDRLRLSRASVGDLTAGFFLGNLAIGAGQLGVLLLLNSVLFGIDYGDSPFTLALLALLFAAFCAAAGLLLGSLARTPGQADALGMIIGMSLPALGGLWWPLEIVPGFMQTLGRLLPSGQAITVFHNLIGRGYGLAENAPFLVGLATWTLALLLAAAWAFRRFARE